MDIQSSEVHKRACVVMEGEGIYTTVKVLIYGMIEGEEGCSLE